MSSDTCLGCVYAMWQYTGSGRLHPNGEGNCTNLISMPELPSAFYYIIKPSMGGGSINRREKLKTPCKYFTHEEKQPAIDVKP